MHYEWYHKASLGILAALWLVFVSNMLGNELVHAEALEEPAYAVAAAEGGEGKAPGKQETATAEDALAMLASTDAGKGEKLFGKCKACHTAEKDGANKVGPNLWDIVGRAKGSHGGFAYSGAMKDKGGDWSFADLDVFLAKPKDFVPGTKMSFAGLKKADQRAAMLLYLRSLSDSPQALP